MLDNTRIPQLRRRDDVASAAPAMMRRLREQHRLELLAKARAAAHYGFPNLAGAFRRAAASEERALARQDPP
jgi:hypothetical protein